jgi:spermidine synthase
MANETTLSNSSRSAIPSLIAICFLLSGATALVYEVLWARMLGLVLGATTVAISAVLVAFMGGLALGSAAAARLISHVSRPVRTYALIEMAIGLYALIVPILFVGVDRVHAAVWQTLHPGSLSSAQLRFIMAALVLVIPTSLMGATLPILVAAVRGANDQRARAVAKLYTLNLAGAIIGTVLAGFFFLPSFGLRMTIWIAAATNLVIGTAAFVFDRKQSSLPRARLDAPDATESSKTEQSNRRDEVDLPRRRRFWFLCAFASGLITISMQIVWSRVLAMIIGSSTYAFTTVLALFLIGLAVGAWIVSAMIQTDLPSLRRTVLIVQLLTAAMLFFSLRMTSAVPSLLIQTGFRLAVNSWIGLLLLQIAASALLILIPAVLMGMMMPIVLTWAGEVTYELAKKESVTAKLVGQSYAVNTVGAIVGAIITAFVLIPMTTTRFAVYCVASVCVGIAGLSYRPRRQTIDRAVARSFSIGVAFVLIIGMLFIWPRLNLNALSVGAYDSFVRVLAKARGDVENRADQAADHQLLMYEEGRTATVSVRRDWGITSVAINGRTNASDADDMPTQVTLGQLGVLTAPRLGNAFVVGFATGVTTGSVLQSPMESVECVEIEPAAIASSRFFDHVNNRPLNDQRLRMIVDDARTFLRVNPAKYDVIISEPSHPWVPGVANLFTREFFALGRDRLRDDGVFVQWLQIYQLSTESLRSVLATFHQVFPHVAVFRIQGAAKGKDLILVGSREPVRLDLIGDRMRDARVAADLKRIGLKNADDVTAWFVCNETRLSPAIAGVVINTDDNMHVETVAPREAFRPSMEENSAWIERLRLLKNR